MKVLPYIVLIALLASTQRGDAAPDYLVDVKPLFASRCFTCHGALKQKAKLRVDTAAGMIAAEVVVAGKPEESRLLELVSSSDVEERMPPEHEGSPFTEAEVTVIRQWIAAGAKAPTDEKAEDDPAEHWSFQKLVRPKIPPVKNANWARNPIDTFVAARHESHDIEPQSDATRLTLIRRLYIDLIGLPPDPEELAALAKDESKNWYNKVVDRLLDDPRHGERWGRHWMDIWRYSDWWGLGAQMRNSQKHIWHWRDWIVESLNADLPYDEMIRLMLAADELHPTDLEKLRASGYLARNFVLFNRNTWMDDTVEHVGKGLLGLTMNCAKCHDHKFDPISHHDYYAMRAFFEPYQVRTDMVPGETDFTKNGIPRAFDALLDAPTYRYIRGNEATPDKSKVIAPGVPEALTEQPLAILPISLPAESWQPERRPDVLEAHISQAREKVAAAEKRDKTKDGALAKKHLALAQQELESVQLRVAAIRAAWEDNKAAATASRLAAIRAERKTALKQAELALEENRNELAEAGEDKKAAIQLKVKKAQQAVAKAKKILTAEISGKETFTPLIGAKWSPTRFLESRTDDPSQKFHPTSTGRRTALAKWITDPANPLTARVAANHIWTRHFGEGLVASNFDFGRHGAKPTHPKLLDWLAIELIENDWSMKHLHRLIVTSSTYRMSSSLAGAEEQLARDPDNQRLWHRTSLRLESQVVRDSILALTGELDQTMGGPPIGKGEQEKSRRRSLYFFHSHNERNLFLTMFDEALVKECYKREQSIIPQQALAMANSKLVLEAAPKIAKRLEATHENMSDAEFIEKAFANIAGIEPSEEEILASLDAMKQWRTLPGGNSDSARAHFVWALLNHNDFITLR